MEGRGNRKIITEQRKQKENLKKNETLGKKHCANSVVIQRRSAVLGVRALGLW